MYNQRYVVEVPDLTHDLDEVVEQPVPITYEDGDTLVHYVDDTGAVLHDPRYADSTCPCHEEGDA